MSVRQSWHTVLFTPLPPSLDLPFPFLPPLPAASAAAFAASGGDLEEAATLACPLLLLSSSSSLARLDISISSNPTKCRKALSVQLVLISVALYICETSVAKALSDEVRLEIKIFKELNNLRGSGLACKSVTAVTTCCLHVLNVVSASEKFFAAFNGVSMVLRGEKSLEC